jgi:Mg-chelatase subunit ChlD
MHRDSALITFVLDESGSMQSIAQSAREGFNEYLQEQIKGDGQTWWTLTTFNSRSWTRFAVIPGEEVRPLDADYSPNGMTALYDAVGDSLAKTRAFLDSLDSDDRPQDVIIVILTDGMENSSRRWDLRQVARLITDAEDDGWQFVFLGADLDSRAVAHNMGMRKAAIVDWKAEEMSHKRAMSEASDASTAYRSTKRQQTRYRDRKER